MQPIALRLFRPDDLAAVMTLFRETIRLVNIRDYSPAQVQAWAPDDMNADAWSARLMNTYTVIAELGGQIVGFGNLEVNGHLDCLYTHADHQRRGIGQEILAAIETEAYRRQLAKLFTEASITARPFFERHGFAVLHQQEVECRGQRFVNYAMEKHIMGEMQPIRQPTRKEPP